MKIEVSRSAENPPACSLSKTSLSDLSSFISLTLSHKLNNCALSVLNGSFSSHTDVSGIKYFTALNQLPKLIASI